MQASNLLSALQWLEPSFLGKYCEVWFAVLGFGICSLRFNTAILALEGWQSGRSRLT